MTLIKAAELAAVTNHGLLKLSGNTGLLLALVV